MDDKNNEIYQQKSFFLIQPFASARYIINTKWNVGISYSKENRISNFSQLYPAIILQNYNSLTQNPEIINKTKSHSISHFLINTIILKGFFFKLTVRFPELNPE